MAIQDPQGRHGPGGGRRRQGQGRPGAVGRRRQAPRRVEKINFIKRHTKARRQGVKSGILEREAPIHISNVMLYDPDPSAARGWVSGCCRTGRANASRAAAARRFEGLEETARRLRPAALTADGDFMADDKKSKAAKAPAKRGQGGKPEARPASPQGAPAGGGESARARSPRRGQRPGEKPRLARHYAEKVRPALMEKFGYKNVMQVRA